MSGKTIKHFIFTRFFSVQKAGYPYDVLDIDFLSKQLPLTKNIFRSLENQTNKDFELIFIVNDKFLTNPKYEFIFSTLKSSTTLPLKFINMVSIRPLLKEAHAKYDAVIQTKMDFDDFIFKDAVAETQAKVNECDCLLMYGYNRGYQYVYGELYPYYYSGNGNGHFSTFQSLILESSFARKFKLYIQIWSFRHGQIKLQIKELLENKKIEFLENMFQLQSNISANSFIYFRHEFSLYQLRTIRKPTLVIPNRSPLTTKDITKEQLKSEFGFDGYELKSIE